MSEEATGLAIQEKDGSLTFPVRVVPRAKKNEIVGVEGGALRVRITAPPIRGKANEALVEFLAQALGVRKRQVEIVRGQRVRNKTIRVRGLSEKEARKRFGNFTTS
ncbi:MAG TPA: YggU family protein [Chloroflexi bacterium]|nr:YggU family protein [Chloroflexota bacterium]